MTACCHAAPPYPSEYGTQPTREHDGQPYRSLFGFAASGVYTAFPVTSEAVVSYTAISSLPSEDGGFFSVALSLESPPPDVIRHPALCSPDFPHRYNRRDHPHHSIVDNTIFRKERQVKPSRSLRLICISARIKLRRLRFIRQNSFRRQILSRCCFSGSRHPECLRNS